MLTSFIIWLGLGIMLSMLDRIAGDKAYRQAASAMFFVAALQGVLLGVMYANHLK